MYTSVRLKTKPSSAVPSTRSLSTTRPFTPETLHQPDTETSPSPADLQAQYERMLQNRSNLTNLAIHPPGVTAAANTSVQTKLTVGAPGDRYEQEADAMAAQVITMPDSEVGRSVQREMAPDEEEVQTKPALQRGAMPEEEETQTKPLAASITPLVQREAMPEEEEVQAKSLDSIQREEMPEEEEVQAKSLGNIQREEMPEEEEVQMKSDLQRSPDGSLQAGSSIKSRLNSSKGGGSPLSDEVRSFMEPRFGADFSQVRVHTGSEAVQMNRDLNAQAFTYQQNVYFGDGKTPGKDVLTAHELTHVVQQTGAAQTRHIFEKPKIQLKCSTCENEEAKVQRFVDLSSSSTSLIQAERVCDDNGCHEQLDPVVIEGDPNAPCEQLSNPSHPSEVSQTLIDRLIGKFAEKDGDPGEGLSKEPYVAAEGQCTIGFGHVIYPKNKCQLNPNNPKKCICQPPYDFFTQEKALATLKSDTQVKANWIHENVHVDLNQAEFDALVDMALHVGSVPKDFLKFLHENWCKDRQSVRERYLKTATTMKDPKTGKRITMKNFVERRKRRVWNEAE
jgi:GH24 family phage-related lysozyme (muramidase)